MTRRYFGKTLIYGVKGSEINNEWSYQLFSLDIGQVTTTKIDMKKVILDRSGKEIIARESH